MVIFFLDFIFTTFDILILNILFSTHILPVLRGKQVSLQNYRKMGFCQIYPKN
jgi:hypothetical protein